MTVESERPTRKTSRGQTQRLRDSSIVPGSRTARNPWLGRALCGHTWAFCSKLRSGVGYHRAPGLGLRWFLIHAFIGGRVGVEASPVSARGPPLDRAAGTTCLGRLRHLATVRKEVS